jgi:hypothetical protein
MTFGFRDAQSVSLAASTRSETMTRTGTRLASRFHFYTCRFAPTAAGSIALH